MVPELESCNAIIEAWYAGEQGGHALADVLFGDYNPSGKLPVTFYRDDSQLPPFDDYRMSGRTYRFFQGEPLFPFGYGLSYTTFQLANEQCRLNQTGAYDVTIDVTNTGQREGHEVVQLYLHRQGDTADGPMKTLRGYARTRLLKPGETQTVTIQLSRSDFEWWDAAHSVMRILPGHYDVMVGTSSADKDLKKLSIALP
jgi:beta-glucosidase